MKIPTDWKKGQASKTNKYRGKTPQNKPRPYPEAATDFQGRCTDLEGYIFDLGPRASKKISQTMKKLEQYLGATYSDIFHPSIMNETVATFPIPEMPTIKDLVTGHPKTDAYMTYLDKNNTNESICQNLRNKDVPDMHKIYNLTAIQRNEQQQEKAALDATL